MENISQSKRSQAEARKPGLQHHMGSTQETLTFLPYSKKGADQPAHPHSLISACVIRFLKSTRPEFSLFSVLFISKPLDTTLAMFRRRAKTCFL